MKAVVTAFRLSFPGFFGFSLIVLVASALSLPVNLLILKVVGLGSDIAFNPASAVSELTSDSYLLTPGF
jgi:hypothetical protein